MQDIREASRRKMFFFIIGLMFFAFTIRLLQLQFIYQDVYGKKSEENSIRPIAHDPIRGYMLDRTGSLLVDNRPSYTVTLTPSEFRTSNIEYVSTLLHLDTTFIQERLKKGKLYNRFAPIK